MSVAPMLQMSTVDTARHLDNPSRVHLDHAMPSESQQQSGFVLGSPSDGTIGQRRKLARAIRSLAQRQLKSYRSGSLRMERNRRICSLEKLQDGSAIDSRRSQNRVVTAKRRGGRCGRPAPDTNEHGLLVKQAANMKSEMVFFGEFKANPRARQWFGCVVS